MSPPLVNGQRVTGRAIIVRLQEGIKFFKMSVAEKLRGGHPSREHLEHRSPEDDYRRHKKTDSTTSRRRVSLAARSEKVIL
jgi:hypothetical protein